MSDFDFAESISVMGLGRVGLPTALCMAQAGMTVYGLEKDKLRLEALRAGKMPFYEPGMQEIFNTTLNRTFFLTEDLTSIRKSTCSLIAVNVPFARGRLALSDLNGALGAVAKNMRQGHLVIIKTTLAPGMTEGYVKSFLEKISGLRCGKNFFLAYVPERSIEGQAIRIVKEIPKVIGATDGTSFERTNRIFEKVGTRNKRTRPKVAEIAKLLENYWRDSTFAIANEASVICSHLDVDAFEAIEAANFGNPWSAIPSPSPGVGGSCLTKDPLILSVSSKRARFTPLLLLTARRLNENVPKYVFDSVREEFRHLRKRMTKSKVMILGLAYKRGTDDTRNSPAESLIRLLKRTGACVMAYDPYASDESYRRLAVEMIGAKEGLSEADCVILMTNHDEFKELDLNEHVKDDCIIADFWGLWNPSELKKGIYCGWRTKRA